MFRFIPFAKRKPLVAVIRLSGTIAASGGGARLNDAALAPMIERAFRRGKPRAVALVINSPGGSPVQSALIAARVRRLATETGVPVHAFVEDVAASGGYWLATSADHIWIDTCSIIGSIGVISAGFGFHDLLARNGIERRVYAAGTSKSMLDPFRPENPEDVTRLRALQDQIHAAFVEQVQSRRGAALNTETDLFNGNIWVGQGGVDMGLADGIGHLVPKMKATFGDAVRFSVYGQRRPFFQRITGQAMSDAMASVEDRALWASVGL
ncbi:S49 family peptidase [Roseicitreum antarcticum]|nr:S49 family peptidase [Roseicitreum antarcticum]